ncbi:hypothetical protein [Micromonospora avicenniae]|uniref:RiboL-PSP-HEPN domain-containing protein n=1 Tax=Micromonospora avicenniae TaxID=1198245 RepID=A0A1N7ER50_9ACTN|nr:hypothetical protein [Micromonospora avicenniae]SIR90524.1 hypothetical protein SAMN05444858_12641 [Micromonospora avicenniae]
MDVQETVDNFIKALEHCQNIIKVHRAVGDGGRGRRVEETSLNRGLVVIAAATWQAFVQDLAATLRDATLTQVKAVAPSPLLAGAMRQWETDFNSSLEKFSTPGPDQTRQLLLRVGFDPRPHWIWQQRVAGKKVLVEHSHVVKALNQWLTVRHGVAHGHASMPQVNVLQGVRERSSTVAVRLTDAIDCMRFLRAVVKVTADAAAAYVGQPVPTWPYRVPLVLGLNPAKL